MAITPKYQRKAKEFKKIYTWTKELKDEWRQWVNENEPASQPKEESKKYVDIWRLCVNKRCACIVWAAAAAAAILFYQCLNFRYIAVQFLKVINDLAFSRCYYKTPFVAIIMTQILILCIFRGDVFFLRRGYSFFSAVPTSISDLITTGLFHALSNWCSWCRFFFGKQKAAKKLSEHLTLVI